MNTVEEVLKYALTKPLTPIEWDETAEMAEKVKRGEKTENGEVVRH